MTSNIQNDYYMTVTTSKKHNFNQMNNIDNNSAVNIAIQHDVDTESFAQTEQMVMNNNNLMEQSMTSYAYSQTTRRKKGERK